MPDDPRAIAHAMLTQALLGQPIGRPALAGSELALAAVWLRRRAASVLAGALRPGDLLRAAAERFAADDDAVASVADVASIPTAAAEAAHTPAPRWQQAAAVNIAAAEVVGGGQRADSATVRLLSLDPDGMLAALAELTAHLYRLHDGSGAGAVVRALRP